MNRDILLSLKFPDRSNTFKKYAEDQQDRGLINPSAFGNRDLSFVPVYNVIRSVMPSNDVLPALGPDDSGFRDNIDANKRILDLLDGLDPMHRYYDDDDISLDPRLDKVINGSNAVRTRQGIHEKEKKGKNSVNLVKQGNISFLQEKGLYDTPQEKQANINEDAKQNNKGDEPVIFNQSGQPPQPPQPPDGKKAIPDTRPDIPTTKDVRVLYARVLEDSYDPHIKMPKDIIDKLTKMQNKIKMQHPITADEYDMLLKYAGHDDPKHDEL